MDLTPIFPREQLLASNGSGLTQGLFYEYRTQGLEDPVYTLKDKDWKGCLSMYKIYMSCDTEYEAAMKLLGSWSHWKRLTEAGWFKVYLNQWREEMDIRNAALGKTVIICQAREGNVTAARDLLNMAKESTGRGRPNKKEKEERLRKEAEIDAKVISLLKIADNV